ncbi:MAG: VWA domain-containing protein [Rubrivivax sp.]|nr:VWA domain-containing protein [Rubrivivax sp.]
MTSAPRTYRNPLAALRQAQVPESVGLELERARRVLESVLSDEAADTLAESLIELRVQGADAALLGAIVRRLSLLAPRLSGSGGLTAWLTAVREVAQQARHCTLAFLESSEEMLRHGSPAELLMWARLGLRHGQAQAAVTEGDATLAHFELRSRESALVVTPGGERVDLASSKARLAPLLRALFEVTPTLLPVEQGLATRRPFLSNLGLHLPEVGRALRGAQARRWYDAAATHAAAHLCHSEHKFERGGLKPIQMALVGLLEDARVEAIASRELPGLRRLWLGFHTAEPAHGNTFVVLMLRLARCLLDPGHDDPHPWVLKARRLFLEATDGGRSAETLAPTALRDMASRLGNDIGQMRLQFNSREYAVEPAYRDDNAHLWLPDNQTTPQTLASADTVPLPPERDSAPEIEQDTEEGEPTPSVRPVPVGEPHSEQPLLARVQYPEWDRLVGDYRSAWCTVLEGRPPPSDPRVLLAGIERHAALLLRLERVLRAGRLRERVRLRSQLRGDELDIDAAVRSAIDRRSHHSPGQKVHQRFDRRERDVAALVLLDSSTSTVDPVAAGGGSILDLAREAALLTTLSLTHAGDHCAVHAFCSNGRHEVRYESALGFDEALDANSIARLAGLQSRLSTRMGAALRHASTLLGAQPHRKRLLLFITDGEPHDIDIHDRRYLVEDARRAVLEAARKGIAVFCVTLDAAADEYVRAIFGNGNYRVLDRIESLPRVLPAMVLRLTC